MIYLVFCSKDGKLKPLLSATLGDEFHVSVETSLDRIRQSIDRKECDVLILDFDTAYGSLEEHLTLFDNVRRLPVPVVVMTDDDRRSTVLELVHRGVYDYFRKPPALAELSRCFLAAR